jgi:hypothetical protein
LGEERAGVFCEVYGVKPAGNCTLSARSDPHKEFGGKNVLAEVRGVVSFGWLFITIRNRRSVAQSKPDCIVVGRGKKESQGVVL